MVRVILELISSSWNSTSTQNITDDKFEYDPDQNYQQFEIHISSK